MNAVILVAASDHSSDDIDTSALPDGPGAVHHDETLEPDAAKDVEKANCKPATSATAELLRGVRDSAGAFGPLKSVAGSLCIILNNCEVWPPSCTFDPQYSRSP